MARGRREGPLRRWRAHDALIAPDPLPVPGDAHPLAMVERTRGIDRVVQRHGLVESRMRGAWTTYSAVVTSLSFSPENVQKAVFLGVDRRSGPETTQNRRSQAFSGSLYPSGRWRSLGGVHVRPRGAVRGPRRGGRRREGHPFWTAPHGPGADVSDVVFEALDLGPAHHPLPPRGPRSWRPPRAVRSCRIAPMFLSLLREVRRNEP